MAKPVDMNTIKSILSDFSIPPRPEMLKHLQKEMDNQEQCLKRIANIIQQDVGISGFTLKVVNSPLFSLPRKITSIEHACMFLGLSRIVRLVNSVVLRFTLSKGDDEAFTQRLWNCSTNVAGAAMALAQLLELGDDLADDMYTAGLFHNAGMALIFAQNADYAKILSQAYNQHSCTISEYENEYLKTSHELLSFLLAQTWGLTTELSNVIAYHHSPLIVLATGTNKEKQMLALLKLSEHYSGLPEMLGSATQDIEWEKYGDRLLDILGLEDFQLLELGQALEERGVDNIYCR
jgi:HD-like signal output (HDOD) protein